MNDQIHVFIGTKAQYIKTAPLLRRMDRSNIGYRLIDTGQHAGLAGPLREELEIRDPDFSLGDERTVESIMHGLMWTARAVRRLPAKGWLRNEVFGGSGGICVVHGDTQSTLLAALMARRAGLKVAHLEAGLRSHSLLHPFPEELIRMAVMRVSDVLFAPDAMAVANLERMRLGGRIVALSANTSAEALWFALDAAEAATRPSVVLTMHRLENLKRKSRVTGFVELAERIAGQGPVTMVLHGPTRNTLARTGGLRRLERAGVTLFPIQPHGRFAAMLRAAPFVVTDGGSVQEECALLGVPTLLWRKRTERPDGLNRNVVLSEYRPDRIATFIRDPEAYRAAPVSAKVSPSGEALHVLLGQIT